MVFDIKKLLTGGNIHWQSRQSEISQKDYDTGKMEVVFHEKNGNEISLDKFTVLLLGS